MYVAKIAEFNSYTHFCKLAARLYDGMLGLGLLFNKKEVILDICLGRGLVFNNKIVTWY